MSNKDENEISVIVADNNNVQEDSDNIVPTNDLASQSVNDLENELAHFRNEWKRELLEQDKKISDQQQQQLPTTQSNLIERQTRSKNIAEYHEFPQRSKLNNKNNKLNEDDNNNLELDADINYEQPQSLEQKAKYLFNKGVLLEQQSRHYEAIKFYRMAMQLDADVEYKLATHRFTKKTNDQTAPNYDESLRIQDAFVVDLTENNKLGDEEGEEESEIKTLYEQFQSMTLVENKFCEKNYSTKSTHFSQLPLEVIVLILKWVVSDHLDMRSLESFSTVCKGFYVCARDPEIWKLACAKIWGPNNINNYLPTYNNWRNMYINRPHLNFEGVYISKASYARAGEQSLDNFYRPWHLVEYYRYLRFFSNGNVIVLTTPDEPKITVSKLKKTTANTTNTTTSTNTGPYSFVLNDHSILKGTWTLSLNKVSIVAIKKIQKLPNKFSRRQKEPSVDQEHVFRMELELSSSEKRLNNQLHWINYEANVINKITNTKTTTKFELNKIDFPSFYFSRVKSYSVLSEMPLK